MFAAVPYNLQGTGEALLAWRIGEPAGFPPKKVQVFLCTKALLGEALNHLLILTVGSFQAWSCTPPLPKTKPTTPCQFLHSSALLLFWFGGAAVIPAPGSHGSAAHTQ